MCLAYYEEHHKIYYNFYRKTKELYCGYNKTTHLHILYIQIYKSIYSFLLSTYS